MDSGGFMDHIDEVMEFGNMLVASGRQIGETATALGINKMTVIDWRQGFGFPEEKDLPTIASYHGIELEVLTPVWRRSFEASKRPGEPIRLMPMKFPDYNSFRPFPRQSGKKNSFHKAMS
jgi:hypothetical protein